MAASDCLRCGTCCFSDSGTYVRVSGADFARLGDRAGPLVAWVGNRAYMRMREGRCAALRVEAQTGSFVCTAYEIRPQVCRDLERGSPGCEGELAAKGSRPLLALAPSCPRSTELEPSRT